MTNQATDMTDRTHPDSGSIITSSDILLHDAETALLYEELRAAIDDGHESMTHADALAEIAAIRAENIELRAKHASIRAGGVQALSAAPAEQQAAPKAAASDPDDHQILAITTAYEQGVGKGRQAHSSGKEIANPYGPGYRCDLAWQYGYEEGKKQAAPALSAAPAEQQAASSAVLKAIREANMQLVRTGDDAFMLVPYKLATAEQQAQPGAVYAELHEPDATTVGLGAVWNRHSMRDFADRTHALRMEQAAPKAAPGVGNSGFDRKPDCYGIRQITNDEGVEEWEDIRTSPDVAREEANDMMATGRGEIYEVVPLWTTPQPAPAPLTDAQIAEMMRDAWGCASIAPRHALEFARAVERAHGIGIKGGQHGTERRSDHRLI